MNIDDLIKNPNKSETYDDLEKTIANQLVSSKLTQFKQWILSIVSVSVASSSVGKCTKCRFNCEDDHTVMNDCNVGSYYAEKGLNRICYKGELWEATER